MAWFGWPGVLEQIGIRALICSSVAFPDVLGGWGHYNTYPKRYPL
jgi:hypothetical protein